MNYQSSLRKMGTMENIRMITDHLDARAKTVVDIGCDAGAYSVHFSNLGLRVDAFEPDASAVAEATALINSNASSVKLHHQLFTLENVRKMPSYDVTCLLSVYHQIVEHNSLEYANDYLVELYRKTRHQFFFQSCMIHVKHRQKMPFIENYAPSILAYFTGVLRAAGEPVHARMLGYSQNGLPSSEPFRPMFLFEKSAKRPTFEVPSMERGGFLGVCLSNLLYVDIDRTVSDQTLQSFGRNGWHHFVEACRSLVTKQPANPSVRAVLDHYYDRFQPRNFGAIWRAAGLDADIGVLAGQPTGYYCNWMPWNSPSDSIEDMKAGKTSARRCPETDNHVVGPLAPAVRNAEAVRLQAVFETMRITGYEPEVNHDGYVRGQLLVRGNDSRFLVTAGQHRLAALSSIGYSQILAKFQHGRAKVIDLGQVKDWPQVANGTYTVTQATAIFNGLFEATGTALGETLRTAPVVAAPVVTPDARSDAPINAARVVRAEARVAARQQAGEGNPRLAMQTLVRAASADAASKNPFIIVESLVCISRDMEPLDPEKSSFLLREAEKIATAQHLNFNEIREAALAI